jgi:hypothetical protein
MLTHEVVKLSRTESLLTISQHGPYLVSTRMSKALSSPLTIICPLRLEGDLGRHVHVRKGESHRLAVKEFLTTL